MMESDSESSLLSYTTTSVLLGYASPTPTDDTVSHLGGEPTWLHHSQPPSASFARCRSCKELMQLLLQIHGDLPERFPNHERRLYVFGCRRSQCRRREGSLRALRGTRIWGNQIEAAGKKDKHAANGVKDSDVAQLAAGLGNSIFGKTESNPSSDGNENPFSQAKSSKPGNGPSNPFSSPSQAVNLLSSTVPAQATPLSESTPSSSSATEPDLSTTFAQKAHVSPASAQIEIAPSTTYEPWPTALAHSYPLSHLDAAYETLDPPSSSQSSSKASRTSLMNSTTTNGTAGAEPDDGKDGVEMSIDSTFQKFADRIAQNPEQVLRYEFGGSPLLYRRDDKVGQMLLLGTSSTVGAGNGLSASITGRLQGSGGVRAGGVGLPRCGHCGSERVFELQLMPHAIVELEKEEEGLDGMEWGTVIVGVCGRDCADGGNEGKSEKRMSWREEWVGVQWEEEVKRK